MAQNILELYRDDLREIEKCTPEEMKKLFPLAGKGDLKARERLIEGNLYRVYDFLTAFNGDELLMGDLLEEGNVALIETIQSLSEYREDTDALMDKAIKERIHQYLLIEAESNKTADKLKAALNELDALCMEMTEELNREPTPEELGKRLKMDPEDVKVLLHLALTAVNKE